MPELSLFLLPLSHRMSFTHSQWDLKGSVHWCYWREISFIKREAKREKKMTPSSIFCKLSWSQIADTFLYVPVSAICNHEGTSLRIKPIILTIADQKKKVQSWILDYITNSGDVSRICCHMRFFKPLSIRLCIPCT